MEFSSNKVYFRVAVIFSDCYSGTVLINSYPWIFCRQTNCMPKPYTYVLLLIVIPSIVFSQDFSNKGRDFWVGYGNHVKMTAVNQANAQEMVLYITSSQNANFKIEIPGTGWSWSGSVMANAVITSPPIPKSGPHDARLVNEGLYKRGIHITSDRAVVAYAHIYNQNVSGATLLFPTNILGIDYYSVNYTQRSNEPGSYSFFYVVATEDDTQVEIIPSKTTRGGRPAGAPFLVTLMKGEIYNVLADEDLTGSKIRSVSGGTTGCKKIAVFSGSGKIFIACSNNQNSADNLMQQAFPAAAWGKKYLTAPTQGMPNNFYRIAVSDPATQVTVNGIPLTGLQGNFYYEYASGTPDIIEASQPVMVTQYMTTQQECGNNLIGMNGDPEMIYLSPVEQTISNITLNSTPNYQISSHFINVIIRSGSVNSFRLDGMGQAAQFTPHPVDPAYSIARLAVTGGPHRLSADTGFSAIAYGYGNLESYGYNAGANVIDLYQYLTVTNSNASTHSPAACSQLPFSIALTLPYQPARLVWDIPLNPTVTDNSPAYSQTFTRNGKQLYVYNLSGSYVYNTPGVYSLKVTVDNPTGQGCSGQQEIEYDFEVYDKPVANFNAVNPCSETAAGFVDVSNLDDRTATKWFWDFGDNTIDSVQHPNHIYPLPGNYNVRMAVMSDIGCVSDTVTKTILIKQAPVARFGTSGNYCTGDRILIADSSLLYNALPLKEWRWDFGDGTPAVTHVTAPAPFTHVYTMPGTYTVKLMVKSIEDCYSVAFEQVVIIHALPTAGFLLPVRVCLPDGAATFTDQSTNPSTAGALSYKWYFDDPHAGPGNPDSAMVQHPVHIFSAPGSYTVRLLVTTPEGCKGEATQVFSSVYAQTAADFTITKTDSCAGAGIHFTDQSDSRGRNVTGAHWDFGDGSTGNLLQADHIFTIADTFEVAHFIVTAEGCHSDTVSRSVIIHALPVAGFTPVQPSCAGRAVQFADASTISGDVLVKWTWDFGDHTAPVVTTGAATYTYAQAGDYPVTLQVETDKGCKSAIFSAMVPVHPIPAVQFQLPEACLLDPFAGFTDQSTIADHSEAQFVYAWHFGDPSAPGNTNFSAAQHGQHRYTAAGNYPVRLRVTSKDGCADSVTQNFVLNGATPVADFIIEQGSSACNDSTIRIVNHSSVDFGTITRLEICWDVANTPTQVVTDETPAPGKVYEYVYPALVGMASEVKQVRMRAWSGGLCVHEVIKTFTLHATPQLEFLPVPGQCVDGAPLFITQAREVNGLPGTGVLSGSGINAAHQFDPALAGTGIHTLLYKFVSSGGCRSEKQQTVTVWALPQASFTVPGSTCEEGPVEFRALGSAAGQTITEWTWDFGDQSPVVTTNTTPALHTFAAAGQYPVSLRAVTDHGCRSAVVTVQLVIDPLPVVDFRIPVICLPLGKSTFTDLSSLPGNTAPVFSYHWNFGDPASGTANYSNQQHPTHFYQGLGPYAVQLTVTSEKGCAASAGRQVTDIVNSPVADFESPAEACTGSLLLFKDKSRDAAWPIIAWNWQVNQVALNRQDIDYAFAREGTQLVALTVTNSKGCSSERVTRQVIIYGYPRVDAGPDLIILEGESAIINARAQGNSLHYRWTPSFYLTNDTLLTPVIKPTHDITYRLTVTGKAGCTAYDDMKVTVRKLPVVPNTFTPNNDGINDVWHIEYLDSYPGNTVEVYNRYGQLVFRSAGYHQPWDGKQNGQPLPIGTYYYIIDPKEGRKKMTGSVTILR